VRESEGGRLGAGVVVGAEEGVLMLMLLAEPLLTLRFGTGLGDSGGPIMMNGSIKVTCRSERRGEGVMVTDSTMRVRRKAKMVINSSRLVARNTKRV
jgi:hypothetical protein